MEPTAVVFDLFGTLTADISQSRWRTHISHVADALDAPPDDLVDLFHQTFSDRATGMLGDTPSILRTFCQRLAITPTVAILQRAMNVRLACEEELLQARDGALILLQELKQNGYRTAVLSDCSPELSLLWPHQALAALIDAMVFSFEVGLKKPHPRVYALVCNKLGVLPSQCLYVGDGGSRELTGARASGMSAVLLGSSSADSSHQLLRYDDDILWDGPRISSLSEVWSLLESKHLRSTLPETTQLHSADTKACLTSHYDNGPSS